MAGSCVKSANVPAKTALCRSRSQTNGFKVAHASANAFVRAWVRQIHNELHYCAVAQRKSSLFRHHVLLWAYNTCRQRQATMGTTVKNRKEAARIVPPSPLNTREDGQGLTVTSRRWPQQLFVRSTVELPENTRPLVHKTDPVPRILAW